jgi:hypothetical protein
MRTSRDDAAAERSMGYRMNMFSSIDLTVALALTLAHVAEPHPGTI